MAAGIKQLTLYSLFYLVSTDERIVFSFLKLWKLRCKSMINYRCMHVRALSCFGHVRLFATLWTAASQASLSMGFSRQGYWTGLPCPRPKDRTCMPCVSCIAGRFLPLRHWENPQNYQVHS